MLAGAAEPVIKQIVGLELGEGPGALATAVSQYLRHGQPGIVVQDALGHPAQEGLGGLGRIGLDEASVAVGQVDDEAMGLALHAADGHQGLPEVHWARRMGQWDEHLLGLAAMLSYIVLDDGVSAAEAVLVSEPLEDALGRVALLLRDLMVIFQELVDDAGEGLSLGRRGVVCLR